MTSNPTKIIQDIRSEFDKMLEFVTGDEAQTTTAYQMERGIFKRLPQLGWHLLALFFAIRSQQAPREPLVLKDGHSLPYYAEKKRLYFSIFGKLPIVRPYFYRKGGGGRIPLDAELSLGNDQYSDVLRDMSTHLGVYIADNKSANILERFLDLRVSTRVFEKRMAEDAEAVLAYYTQKPPPPPASEAELLVIQADGKGVPMILETPTNRPTRLGKGEKRGKKKEAIVTSVYTVARKPRTPQAVVASFFNSAPDLPEQKERPRPPKPHNKQVWATLAGKDVALDRLIGVVVPRQGRHIQDKVALCDGCPALQTRVRDRFPDFSLVLDFIHANEYLWKVANRLWGENDPQRTPWVAQKTLEMLSGKTAPIITEFRHCAQVEKLTRPQVESLTKTAHDFERNWPHMDYPTYLANGCPIASGVIEGACRHWVKDRLELSGMRWSQDGAESVLQLRAVAENGDWDDYHGFRRQQRHQRLYAPSNSDPTLSEPTLSLPKTPAPAWVEPANVNVPNSYEALPLAA